MSGKIERFETTLSNFSEVNEGFIKATINVFTKDQVANGFIFEQAGIDKRIKNWDYLPVKAEYIEEKSDFGSHGGKLILSDDGIEYIQTTKPMGVVIANSGRMEDVVCMNGETKAYFCVDVYLWHDQFKKELDSFRQGEFKSQSMEVEILDSTYDSNVEYVTDFKPLALCILGDDVAPAFKDSKVKVQFESDEFKAQYDEMLSALDKYLKFNERRTDMEDTTIQEIEIYDTSDVEQEVETVEDVACEDTQSEQDNATDCEMEVVNETQVEMEDHEDQDETEEDMKKKRKCEEEYAELQAELTSLQIEYSKLETKYQSLEAEHNSVLAKYNEKIAKEEFEDKLNIVKSFNGKLTEDEIKTILPDINEFTAEEVDNKLTIALGKKIKAETFSQEEIKEVETKTFSAIPSEVNVNTQWGYWLSKMN